MYKAGRRKPLPVDRYLAIHTGNMRRLYDKGIIEDDDLVIDWSKSPVITMKGAIRFGTDVELRVDKLLEIQKHYDDVDCLVTTLYSYVCCIRGLSNSDIFRYDNWHEDRPHKGHATPHHVHRFDPPGRQVLGSPFHLSDEERPVMSEIIEEAYQQSEAYKSTPGKYHAAKPKRKKKKRY